MLGSCRTDISNQLADILPPVTSDTSGSNELADIMATTTITLGNIDDSIIARTQELLGSSAQDMSPTISNKEEAAKRDTITIGSASGITIDTSPQKQEEIQEIGMWPSTGEGTLVTASNEVIVTGTVAASATAPPKVKEDDPNDLPTWPASSQEIVDVKEEEEQQGKRLRDRKPTTKFSKEEDQYLIRGVQKYGRGHWGKIFKDPAYKFDGSRSRDSLRMRYSSREVKRLVKDMEMQKLS